MANPKLRFKADNGNDYPDWVEKKLGDAGTFRSGIGFSEKYQGHKDYDIPVYKVSDMNNAGNEKVMTVSNNTVNSEIANLMKTTPIKGGSIIFAKVGAAIFMERKRISLTDFIIDNNMMSFSPTSLNLDFAYHLCNRLSFSRYAQVGALPSYNASDIGAIKCRIPSLPEQQKIASFLSSIDEKINLTDKQLGLLKQYKQGVMQQIFNQEIRFKDDNGNDYPDWMKKKLGDVATGFDYGLGASSIAYDGENKYIRITDIDDASREYIEDGKVSPSGELDEKCRVKNNDILLARTGASVGKSFLYKEKVGKAYFAGFLIRISVKVGYSSYFVYLNTLTNDYLRWVKVESMRSGQPGINAEQYKNFEIPVPSLPEQQKIASFLFSIDEKIALVDKQLSLLKEYKKSLMQKMFV